MKKVLLCSALVTLAVTALTPRTAEACGGCFVPQDTNTQVVGHRMAMSISQGQTTLYDQIQYAGSPDEFAWILPIRGQVEVGLSSDALFALLESLTQVTVTFSFTCPICDSGDGGSGAGSFNGSVSAGGSTGGGVEVIAAAVVGPYETVQLSSTDPNALLDWLDTKGFVIPPDIESVIDDYVAEGFDFLALRLVPGAGIDAMRPIRISVQGASPELPLRMVAAGTGANTVVNLWVLGEGRYEPQNFPSFEIQQRELVWNLTSSSSNYASLRAARFEESNGFAWHAAAASPYPVEVFDQLINLASTNPEGSGYANEDGLGAVSAAQADISALLAGFPGDEVWISKLDAELSRAALATDLVLEASIPQTTVPTDYAITAYAGPSPCQPCGDGGGGGEGGYGGYGASDGSGGTDAEDGGSRDGCGGCSTGGAASGPFTMSLVAALGLTIARRRRRR